jgi:hypothetical protein
LTALRNYRIRNSRIRKGPGDGSVNAACHVISFLSHSLLENLNIQEKKVGT